MKARAIRYQFWITLTFLMSLILMIMPFPKGYHWLSPEWVVLVFIYWVLALPRWVGIGTGFWLGLAVDLLNGYLLGQMALALVLVAFLTNLFRNKMRYFRFWQQTTMMLLLIGSVQLTLCWIQWLVGHPPYSWMYLCSIFSSAFVWPFLYFLLQSYQFRLHLY